MTYDRAHFEAAHARLRRAPLELTDQDLAQLATLDPKFDTEGREARTRAQRALVQKHLPALQTKRTSAPLTVKHLDMLIGVLAEAVRPLRAQVNALEARLAAIEGKPHVKFTGTFKPGETYTPGDAATHHGSLWICKAATSGKPGEDHIGWQLAVKSRSIV